MLTEVADMQNILQCSEPDVWLVQAYTNQVSLGQTKFPSLAQRNGIIKSPFPQEQWEWQNRKSYHTLNSYRQTLLIWLGLLGMY